MARVHLHEANGGVPRRGGGLLFSLVGTIAIILVYFPVSIGLTFYQRWFVQKFHYPLFVAMCHFLIKFSVSAVLRSAWQCWHRKARVRVDWPNTLKKIAPMGFVSGLDIGFSNWGLEFITVSLYTMTKATSIIFILFFALLFKLEEKSWTLFVIVAMISGGLTMFTYKATQFNLLGFLLVIFASFSSGLRWTIAQFVMHKTDMGLGNPIDMLYHVQPWMFLSIFPFVIGFEAGPLSSAWSTLVFPRDWPYVLHTTFFISLGAVIALTMELSEYLIISHMSSLTLSVVGIFKEICSPILAKEWNGDQFSNLNVVGLLMCLGGIICHVVNAAIKQMNAPFAHPGTMTDTHKPLLDEASAHFLAEMSTSDDDHEDSSTEVLFSVLHSRDR